MSPKKRKGERPSGLIQVSVTLNGKRYYFYGHSRSEAIKKRDDFKAGIKNKITEAKNITVEEWVIRFLGTYRNRINEAYEKNDNVPYNRLVKRIGDKRIVDVTEADLQSALNEVAGMSFSTCRNYRQAIKRVFRKAVKNNIIPNDPSEEIKMPSYTKGSHRALEDWEIATVLKYWNTNEQWAGIWIMIMLLCGLRRGEMMALQWKDVDLESRLIHVTQVAVVRGNQTIIEKRAKSDAGIRDIPICKELYDALSIMKYKSGNDFVCVSSRNERLSETAVSRGIEKSMKVWSELIGRDISFRTHDLRHTYATMLYESGVDVKIAQTLLGHSDLKLTLQIYTHVSKRHKNGSESILTNYLNNLSYLE